MTIPTSKKREIIDLIVTRLKTIRTELGISDENHIFTNPFREIDTTEVPCLKIALMNGDAERFTNAIEYANMDRLMIAYIMQDNGDLHPELYDKGEFIADFIIRDENDSQNEGTLNSVLSDLKYVGWDIDLKLGAIGAGAIVLKFDIKYHTEHKPVFENDLETVSVDVRVDGLSDEEGVDPYPQINITLPTE